LRHDLDDLGMDERIAPGQRNAAYTSPLKPRDDNFSQYRCPHVGPVAGRRDEAMRAVKIAALRNLYEGFSLSVRPRGPEEARVRRAIQD